jgi:2-polyprenyl-6-methoxyphenol hydroxylase-like FAD-dependent oxidoreductase
MRRITIIGAGQAGLQLALGLVKAGYEVTCVSNRTPDEVRHGHVMSSQCMFGSSLVHERALGLNFWDDTCPPIEGLSISIAHPELTGARVIDFASRFDRPALSVDQRVKFPHWMELLASRGGKLRIQDAGIADLEHHTRESDLVIVASGKADIARLFGRNAACSPYPRPMRELTLTYVTNTIPRPDFLAVRFNICPGVGEFFVIPGETTTGPCDIMVFEAIPGGPMDCWLDVATPAQHLARSKELIAKFFPWELEANRDAELTDANGIFTGRIAPVVRAPVGVLPSGRAVMGMGDTVVLNDPITGQGSGNASKAAAVYLAAIREHGDRPFDTAWMQQTFELAWSAAKDTVDWTNALLSPPPPHVLALFGAACHEPKVAHRFVNGFDLPSDYKSWFMTPEAAQTYLRELGRAP